MRLLILTLGAPLAAMLVGWGVPGAIDAADSLSGTRIGATRTPMPGARIVTLDSGKHTVFYEVDDGAADGEEIEVPALDVSVRPAKGGEPLELEGFSGDLDLTSAGRAATAVGAVRVPEDGRYRVAATGEADAAAPAVVLGRPITARVLRLLVAIAAVFTGVCLGILVGAVALALRAGRRHPASG